MAIQGGEVPHMSIFRVTGIPQRLHHCYSRPCGGEQVASETLGTLHGGHRESRRGHRPWEDVVLLLVGRVCGQKTSKFFVCQGRIHGRTQGCKWGYYKLGKGTTKKAWWVQLESAGRELLLFSRCV
jgi:hypothetical protein